MAKQTAFAFILNAQICVSTKPKMKNTTDFYFWIICPHSDSHSLPTLEIQLDF